MAPTIVHFASTNWARSWLRRQRGEREGDRRLLEDHRARLNVLRVDLGERKGHSARGDLGKRLHNRGRHIAR
jgi:hypothetical protein